MSQSTQVRLSLGFLVYNTVPLDVPPDVTFTGKTETELLHTYSRIDPYDTLILCVRLAVLTAVTLTVPIVLFPVSYTPLHYTLFPRLKDRELILYTSCWGGIGVGSEGGY